MKRMELNKAIELVGVDACSMVISKMRRGQKIDGSKLSKIISDVCSINEVTFENNIAQSMIDTLVKNWISERMNGLYRMIFPKFAMNCNGDFTSDSSKWV